MMMAEYWQQFLATLHFSNNVYNSFVYNSLRIAICNMCFVKHFRDKKDILR